MNLPLRRVMLALVGLGAFTLVTGGTGGSGVVPVDALLAAAGQDYWVVGAVGAVGVVVGLAAVASGRDRNIAQAETPEPETRIAVPAPGDPFEERLGDWRFVVPVLGATARAAVRERLERAAVRTIARTDEVTPSEARASLADGSWTSDSAASAYFREPDGGRFAWGWQTRTRARRAAAVVVAYGGRSP